MTDDGSAIRDAVAGHDAFEIGTDERDGTTADVTTTAFDATVTVRAADGPGVAVTVTVEMPTLRAAASSGDVGPALLDGWLDTLERRLADAPKATRASVELDEFTVGIAGDRVTVTYEYTFGDAERAMSVAKTFVEYVEGTYVQGVVPGFDYDPPVSELLSEADQSGGDGPGGTPL